MTPLQILWKRIYLSPLPVVQNFYPPYLLKKNLPPGCNITQKGIVQLIQLCYQGPKTGCHSNYN
jgi:hypothetical protein